MLYASAQGGIEVRAEEDGTVRLSGKFPYGERTELAPGRSEVFAAGSLEPQPDVYLLSQHRFETPLASRKAGTLSLNDSEDGLTFEARISPEVAGTTHGSDALAMIRSGLAVGLSPGFRVARGGERVERSANGLMRTVTRAELHELSIVTKPAFSSAQVEARSWEAGTCNVSSEKPAAWRWR